MTLDRTAYTTGLRRLADALDNDPDLPLPYTGSRGPMLAILPASTDQKVALRAYARAFDGPATKGYRGEDFDLMGSFAGLSFNVIADRDQVCTRVVTGSEVVTREVADPEALAAVPTTTVTETVEIVEWVCEPLLAEVTT